MKYIDGDLLRKDIDNWKEAMTDAVGEYSDGVRFALEHFTFVLDSLSEEPDKSLEEAADEYASDSTGFIDMTAYNAFIAGAEWQRELMMDEWLKDRDGCFWDGVEEGKKSMREQMLKDAVEGYVTQKINGERYAKAQVPDSMGLKFGDKVKLIIVKED